MLLPMLSIYQEYVRNHHYSLQVLTECKQSSSSFAALLSRLENKTTCQGRSLETFLTYPMHQVSFYFFFNPTYMSVTSGTKKFILSAHRLSRLTTLDYTIFQSLFF